MFSSAKHCLHFVSVGAEQSSTGRFAPAERLPSNLNPPGEASTFNGGAMRPVDVGFAPTGSMRPVDACSEPTDLLVRQGG